MKDIGSILESKGCKQFQRIGLLAVCFAILALAIVTPTALAQTTVSTIEGTIKDAQGSVVSGATVVAKSTTLGIERTSTSDENGFYRLAALPAGTYSLSITHSGFATKNFENVELTVNRTLSLDIPLEVKTLEGQVDVVAEAQLLNPTTSALALLSLRNKSGKCPLMVETTWT